MNKKTFLLLGVLVTSVLFVSGCNVLKGPEDTSAPAANNAVGSSAMERDGPGHSESTSKTMNPAATAQFITASGADSEKLLGNEPHALFFHATWCPVCRQLESQINQSLSSFPNGTKILQVNYDTEKDLKKKYGVTVQTTFIILDKDGNVHKKLLAPSLAKLKTAIAETL